MIVIVSRRAIMIASRSDHWLKLLGGGGGGPWVNFSICPSESLPHYSLFCGQLQTPSKSHLGKTQKIFLYPKIPKMCNPILVTLNPLGPKSD